MLKKDWYGGAKFRPIAKSMTSACVRPRCLQGWRNWEVQLQTAQFLYWFLFDAQNWCHVQAWGDVKDNSRKPSYIGKCKIDAKLMLRSTTSSSARPRVAQASISEWLIHQHIEVFHREAVYSSEIATCESQVKLLLMHSVQKKLSTKQASQLEIEFTCNMMSHIVSVCSVSCVNICMVFKLKRINSSLV